MSSLAVLLALSPVSLIFLRLIRQASPAGSSVRVAWLDFQTAPELALA